MNAAEQNQRRINHLRAEEDARGRFKGNAGHMTLAQKRLEQENRRRLRGPA